MKEEKKDCRSLLEETDDFWDISAMLPERRTRRRFSSDTGTVTVDIGTQSPTGQQGERIPQKTADRLAAAKAALQNAELRSRDHSLSSEPSGKAEAVSVEPVGHGESYCPDNNPLLRRVTVKPWPARYSFYEQFIRNGKKWFRKTCDSAEPVPFFSYIPQYSQLSAEQMNYYLFLRGKFRENVYPDADYSYILLYLYEIINLPELIPPEQGIGMLCRIWYAYRERIPRLDRLLGEWVCDYCLIHRVNLPSEFHEWFGNMPAGFVSLREFYFGKDNGNKSPAAAAMFAFSSNYDWKKSKYMTPENRELFEKHITGCFFHCFEKVDLTDREALGPVGKRCMVPVTVLRDAYSGALCAYTVKRRIEVEYLSCSRSPELRYAVTDLIKYAENHVRAMIGVRSRFHTPALPPLLKRYADEYFAAYPVRKKQEKEEPAPEYERYYESEHREFSPDIARAMEEKAWETTDLLVEEDIFAEEEPTEADKTGSTAVTEKGADTVRRGIIAVLRGDMKTFRSIAAEEKLLPDTLCERINEALYDLLCDTALEPADGGWRVIEDYREDIEQWLKT